MSLTPGPLKQIAMYPCNHFLFLLLNWSIFVGTVRRAFLHHRLYLPYWWFTDICPSYLILVLTRQMPVHSSSFWSHHQTWSCFTFSCLTFSLNIRETFQIMFPFLNFKNWEKNIYVTSHDSNVKFLTFPSYIIFFFLFFHSISVISIILEGICIYDINGCAGFVHHYKMHPAQLLSRDNIMWFNTQNILL